MNRPVIVRSSAEADIAAAAVWYENQAQGLGTRFLDAVQDAIHRATVLPRAICCCAASPRSAVC